ncbi:hypothetical protein [Sphingomonas sp. NFR15]|uniref:hypothetical protein n=1 Tax=Sphingomonas sp. NFR15 TaxID=1566282 RepID=UPI000880ECD2|nr:hypothetical protein [Sphingomonas sp. NFR15]SDA15108.1 hypothetical protein SAMN03159340_00642 [Sphingomonas sp. NFR15]
MQLFLAAGLAAASAPSIAFAGLWWHEHRLRRGEQLFSVFMTQQRDTLLTELRRLKEVEAGRSKIRSAAIARGNRTRSWRRAAAEFDPSKYEKATVGTVVEGTRVIVDEGFPCIKPGTRHYVRKDENGFYIACTSGSHYLEGQLEEGDVYLGVYLAPSPRDEVPAIESAAA